MTKPDWSISGFQLSLDRRRTHTSEATSTTHFASVEPHAIRLVRSNDVIGQLKHVDISLRCGYRT
jgi:hypothetical protein